MRARQELYSNSGMNGRLEQPAVRRGVRKGVLFVWFSVPLLWWTALRRAACCRPLRPVHVAVVRRGRVSGARGWMLFPSARPWHGRPSSGGQIPAEPLGGEAALLATGERAGRFPARSTYQSTLSGRHPADGCAPPCHAPPPQDGAAQCAVASTFGQMTSYPVICVVIVGWYSHRYAAVLFLAAGRISGHSFTQIRTR